MSKELFTDLFTWLHKQYQTPFHYQTHLEEHDHEGIPRSVLCNPPLYDQKDLFHPLHDRDFRMLVFVSCDLASFQMEAMMSARIHSSDSLVDRLAQEIMSKVHMNRKS